MTMQIKVFVPYIMSKTSQASRVDVVWDTYIENSLKTIAKNRHGTGKGIKSINKDVLIPSDW